MVLSNQGPLVLMEVMVENQDETEDANQDEIEVETGFMLASIKF